MQRKQPIKNLIDRAFVGMMIDDERIVKHFVFTPPKTIDLFGANHQSRFATIIMVRKKSSKIIKVLYRYGDEHLPFDSAHEKKTVVELLKLNHILPESEDFFNAVLSHYEIIRIVDEAFEGMKTRKEKAVIIRLFDCKKPTILSLPSGNQEANFVKIILIQNKKGNFIKVLYGDNNLHALLPFTDADDKKLAMDCLHRNRIHLTAEELLASRSLINTPGIGHIFGCGEY